MRRSISSLSHRALCGPRCRDGARILRDLTMRTENPSRGGTVDPGGIWEAASLPRNARNRCGRYSGSAETNRGGRHGRLTPPPQSDDNGRSLGAGFSLVLGPLGPTEVPPPPPPSSPRTPITMPSGVILLGQVAQRLPHLDVDCGRCGRHGRLSLGRLLAEHGPELPMPALGRILAANCPARSRGADEISWR